MSPAQALSRLDEARAGAARAIALERIAPAARGGLIAAALMAALGLIGVWQKLHPLAHALAGLAAIALTIAGIWLTARGFRAPSAAETDKRVERDSGEIGLADGLDDRPAGGDPLAHAVWRAHQERLAEKAGKLRVKGPRGLWNAIDPIGARWALATLLIAAALHAGREAPARFMESFSPPWGALLGDGRLTFDAWATPPDYTGASAVYLAGRAAAAGVAPSAPEGSILTVRVFGAKGAPVLAVRSAKGVQRVKFSPAGRGAFEAKAQLRADSNVEVLRFGVRARWRVTVIDDKSPQVAFLQPARAAPDERVDFSWRASDDFGVRRAWLKLRLLNPGPGPDSSNVDEVRLSLATDNGRIVQAVERLDLLAHQFAGLKVEARVIVADALGQRAESKPVTLTLPEKAFENPLARAIVEARRVLLRERRQYDAGGKRFFEGEGERLKRAPDGVKRAAKLVDAITTAPADYFPDSSIYLGLRYARGQVENARTIQEAHVAGGTLWAIALKLEYGDRAEAEMRLDAAREALEKAIRDGADPKTIERLVAELKQAIEDVLEARAAEALAKGEEQSPSDAQKVEEKDIQEMLKAMQDAAKSGQKEQAQRMLDQLGDMMDDLNVQPGDKGQETKEGDKGEQKEGQQGEIQDALSKLGQVMESQRALSDETFQKAQEGSGGGDEKMSKAQGDVAGELAQAAGKAGKQPGSQALEAASQAMKAAQKALSKGDYAEAMSQQAQAISKMREGAASLSKAAMAANTKGKNETSTDPLGRQPGSGTGDGEGVNVPDYAERARAQQLLDEIKKRAAKADVAPVERSYLERLLERF